MNHDLGSRENPIKCDGPNGERAYLNMLIGPNGKFLSYRRKGSSGRGPHGNTLDCYVVTSLDQAFTHNLYFDMYWSSYIERNAPSSFSLVDEEIVSREIMNAERDLAEKKTDLEERYGTEIEMGFNFGYLWSKAKRLQLVGPTFYASRDFFSQPKASFNLIDILKASKEITDEIRGWHKENPIRIANVQTIIQLAQTFHYEIQVDDNIVHSNETTQAIQAIFTHSVTGNISHLYFLVTSG